MEATTGKQEELTRGPENEQTWRAHVASAEDFRGSDAEYCRRNRIDHRAFRSYKKKFGTVRSRAGRPKAFVKVETESLDLRDAVPERPRMPRLPDPQWTAEFIAALMEARE